MGRDVFQGLFGGGAKYDAPDPMPMPSMEKAETETAATRDAERRKLRARAGGVRSTLLGTQLGATQGGGNSLGLLGRSN